MTAILNSDFHNLDKLRVPTTKLSKTDVSEDHCVTIYVRVWPPGPGVGGGELKIYELSGGRCMGTNDSSPLHTFQAHLIVIYFSCE